MKLALFGFVLIVFGGCVGSWLATKDAPGKNAVGRWLTDIWPNP